MTADLEGQPRAGLSRNLRRRCVVAVAIITLLWLAYPRNRELPLTAFSVVGYTNDNRYTGWQAIIQVSNALPFEIECGACSGSPGPGGANQSVRRMDPSNGPFWHALKPRNPVKLLDHGLRPVVKPMPFTDPTPVYVRYREVGNRVVSSLHTEQFLVTLERTNNTRVVVFYGSTRLSPLDWLRIWINAQFGRTVIRESPRKSSMADIILAPPDSDGRLIPGPRQ